MLAPSLLNRNGVGSSLAVQVLLIVAQFGLVSNIDPYFIRTEDATSSVAALHLLPAPAGNAIGALVGGSLVGRYDLHFFYKPLMLRSNGFLTNENTKKRYKLLSIVAAMLGIGSFVAIMLRWHGRINIWESLYIFPVGLAVGLLSSTQYVGVSAAVERKDLATVISMLLLGQQISMMVGAGSSSALLRKVFHDALADKLGDRSASQKVRT
ncbi:MAG: hypothetical protein Q9221_009166 [Calogaya cf. arnoldii]